MIFLSFNKRNPLIDSLKYLVSRNNGVPPAPPTLEVLSTSPTSITLGWTPPTLDGGAPLISYRIHYHKEFGDWDRIEVNPEMNNFTLRGLKCGTNYQFYIQALNDFGIGERTETISTRTSGTSPIAPEASLPLIKTNSTSITLNLNLWHDGGCQISSFVIEYLDHSADHSHGNGDHWILVNNNVKPHHGEFAILDLKPETRYTLKMTAHNAAGSTVKEYDFTTLTFNGGKILKICLPIIVRSKLLKLNA